ncbi:MAG: hypothetical protein A2161_13025 [Candidatus Schekmanbacteria bacterium RBG_13_48_7]|uniref:Lipid A biosynthesis acyltransferase n=1 Tax=Candidatus Schekmanbacteria bacterium RBG_13_48_7 TaxID=1817878 RepID=A0A1F7RJI9_9BACT|nr:MAG: hypothetical protein A2161_13025 [Candidatus Schekmanbacteria bacterium RBG_13_48_7]
MNVIIHLIEYYGLVFIRQCVKLFSPGMVYKTGCFLGSLVYGIIRIRRQQVLENLDLAFPEKTEVWKKQVARETFQLSAAAMLEFLKLPEFTHEYIERYISISGMENLELALQNGRGVIVGGGHFGNWEYNGAVFPVLGYPTNFVMVEQHNLLIHGFTNKLRRMKGINCISTRMGTREIVRRLHQNQLVCMLYDQDARKYGIFVDFFKFPASTHSGLAFLAWKTGAAIVTSFMFRIQGDHFHMVIDPPIWADSGMNREENIVFLTKKLNTRLEEMIREHPAHWFWYHKRWKTKQLS